MRQQDHLVRMANQIARNFETITDVDPATATADHIASFWEPRMIAALMADPHGLTPIAAAALARLATHGAPPPQTRATTFDPAQSDAG